MAIESKPSFLYIVFHGIRANLAYALKILLSLFQNMVESGFSSSSHFAFPNPTQLVSIKLDETNYLAWTAQFKPILKSHNLLGFIDGSNLCPAMFVDDNAAKISS